MFSLREFVKKGFISAIGNQSDYWIILNAANWYEKGILLESDLVEINNKIDENNTLPIEEPIEIETLETEEQENISEE